MSRRFWFSIVLGRHRLDVARVLLDRGPEGRNRCRVDDHDGRQLFEVRRCGGWRLSRRRAEAASVRKDQAGQQSRQSGDRESRGSRRHAPFRHGALLWRDQAAPRRRPRRPAGASVGEARWPPLHSADGLALPSPGWPLTRWPHDYDFRRTAARRASASSVQPTGGRYRPTPAVSSTFASSRKCGMTSSAKSCIISSVCSWLGPVIPEQRIPAFSSSEKTRSLSRTVAGLP